MMQSDLQPTLAQKHTNTHIQKHTIPINLSDNLYWALLERKKGMRKSIGHPEIAGVPSHVVTTRAALLSCRERKWKEMEGNAREDVG